MTNATAGERSGAVPPPPINTGDPGSFAMRTIVERKPKILAQVLARNTLSPRVTAEVMALLDEIRNGLVTDPFVPGAIPRGALAREEQASWERCLAPAIGRSWLAIPWYLAEAFFYLRLLTAVGYWSGAADPFSAVKEEELTGPQAGLFRARGLSAGVEGASEEEALTFLLHACLWGNRVDLSNYEMDDAMRGKLLEQDRANILVDDTEQIIGALSRARRVHVVLDNAGAELVADLFLAERLLARDGESGPRSVTLHAKRFPFFVSDAMRKDIHRTIGALADDPHCALIGRSLRESASQGRLSIHDHWVWSSAEHFSSLPSECARDLAEADIVLIKGDANYRRLLQDRTWETWRRMEEIAGGFPAPFASLRTMKSEIVVDIPADRARALAAEDPDWLINGRRGLIRYCRPGEGRS